MSPRRSTDFRSAVLVLGIVACVGAAQARTEAEAVDELFAVLGATLPCARYAVAWLAEPPSRIEHRCAATVESAALLRQEVPTGRVSYTVDMRVARERYASVYRLRGTATPSAVLAQFLSGVVALTDPASASGRRLSPLVVYSRSTVQLTPPSALVTGWNTSEARKASPGYFLLALVGLLVLFGVIGGMSDSRVSPQTDPLPRMEKIDLRAAPGGSETKSAAIEIGTTSKRASGAVPGRTRRRLTDPVLFPAASYGGSVGVKLRAPRRFHQAIDI